ncbi:MAG: response regulator [Desulfobacteraceae bacterium]|nr:response regulator [Desulfobacteraceae bacterium]
MQATILVVDDQATVLSILKGILSKGPYNVLGALSAQQALEILERQSVDVIISDERMPGMSGSDFLAIARERYPETVRIILTGYASLESAIKAINEGEIYRFLTKPCRSQELHAAVEAALAHRAKGKSGDQCFSLMENLEKQAPGITQVKRDENGVIIIDEEK